MKSPKFILSLLLIPLLFASCIKESTSYPVSIKLTDAPGPYDAVMIDLQGVELTGNDGKSVLMDVNTGIYNLLDFTNGNDTLIATGGLDVSKLSQIRLILGPNNSVVVNNVTYPLSTPSAEQTGLKLQVHATLEAGVMYNILLDFDANKSIIQEGNGTYKLKPVIRTIQSAISGSLKGNITPIGTTAAVTAISSTNISYSSNVNDDGKFMIMGLPEGTYTLKITPVTPFVEVVKNNVIISTGVTTDVGTIALQ